MPDQDPVFALLAAVVLGGPVSAVAPTGAFDWDRLAALARRHRVEGLVSHWVETHADTAPRGLCDRLRAGRRRQALSFLMLTQETLRLLSVLGEGGVRAMALKGAATAHRLYDAQAELRHTSDIDLLVAPDDSLPASARSMALYLANAFEFTHGATGVRVELHHRLAHDPTKFPDSFATLEARGVDLALGGAVVRAQGALDEAVYLCLHGADHVYMRLKWLADIARLDSRASGLSRLDIVAHARAMGCEREARLSFALLDHLRGGAGQPVDATTRAFIALAQETMARDIDADDNALTATTLARRWREMTMRLRLSASPASLAYAAISQLCHQSDLKALGLGVRWRFVYALLGRPMALWRRLRATP